MEPESETGMIGNVAIGQMGGPTPVINASLVGILNALAKHGFRGKIYMPEGGVRGFVEGKFNLLDDKLFKEKKLLEILSRTPGSDGISSRDKADDTKCQIIIERCKALGINTLFLIGGNDTAENARIIAEFARKSSQRLKVFHVPKTIDCDLLVNDHTPGFPSAATMLATVVARINYENRSMGGVNLVVTMGRDSSYLALATAAAKHEETDAPHLIYPSEIEFDPDQFVADIKKKMEEMKAKGRNGVVVVVSEGIRVRKDGKLVLYFEDLAAQFNLPVKRDAHGNVRMNNPLLSFGLELMINQKWGDKSPRITSDVPNYLPRCWEATDLDRSEAIAVGEAAVSAAYGDLDSGTIILRRKSGSPYKCEMIVEPDISKVAKLAKPVPRDFVNAEGNYPSEKFLAWVKPLMGEVFRGASIPRNIIQIK